MKINTFDQFINERNDLEVVKICHEATERLFDKIKQKVLYVNDRFFKKRNIGEFERELYQENHPNYELAKTGTYKLGDVTVLICGSNKSTLASYNDEQQLLKIYNEPLYQCTEAFESLCRDYNNTYNKYTPAEKLSMRECAAKMMRDFLSLDLTLVKNTVYHEFVHHFDNIRGVLSLSSDKLEAKLDKYLTKRLGKYANTNAVYHYQTTQEYLKEFRKNYYQSEHEYNAFLLAALTSVFDDVRKGKPLESTPKEFMLNFMNNPELYYKQFPPKMQQSMVKRAYEFYHVLKSEQIEKDPN